MEVQRRPQSSNKLRRIIKDIIEWVVLEIRESGSTNIIEKELINPLLTSILNRLIPYIVTSSVIFLLVIASVIIGITWMFPKPVIHS